MQNKREQSDNLDERPPHSWSLPYEYQYLTEFQSHKPEFDYLKSVDIDECINVIAWVKTSEQSRMLLSTNDKTVKLWKARCSCFSALLHTEQCICFSRSISCGSRKIVNVSVYKTYINTVLYNNNKCFFGVTLPMYWKEHIQCLAHSSNTVQYDLLYHMTSRHSNALQTSRTCSLK